MLQVIAASRDTCLFSRVTPGNTGLGCIAFGSEFYTCLANSRVLSPPTASTTEFPVTFPRGYNGGSAPPFWLYILPKILPTMTNSNSMFEALDDWIAQVHEFISRAENTGGRDWPQLREEILDLWGECSAFQDSTGQISAEYAKIPGASGPDGAIWEPSRAVRNWFACVKAFHDPQKRLAMLESLTGSQVKCLTLLLEWWLSPPGAKNNQRPWISKIRDGQMSHTQVPSRKG
jgi:hypothetical protein